MKDDPLFRELPDSFDERVPPPPPPRRLSWDLGIGALLWLAFPAVALLEIVPRFGEVYRQVKVPMPGITLTAMTLSEAAAACPMALAFLITVASALLTRLSGRGASLARIFLPLLGMVLWIGLLAALFMPLTCCHLSIGARR
ncbi:MAG: hypothetical protein HY293_11580 [Planctomycetes bacterium]|nr:hypothetical protein [Planctomycetota bacterium]